MLDHQNIPKVSLEFMNQDHQEITEIFNRLEVLALNDAAHEQAEKLDGVFAEFLDHHREHFRHEEEEMALCNFPAFSVHQAEHNQVLGEIETEYNSWCTARDLPRLRQFVVNRFPDWLMNHIVTMDTVTATYISQMTLNKCKGL